MKQIDQIRAMTLRARHVLHIVGHQAHRAEHPPHLAYFGGLATGIVDYHLVAFFCLGVGIFAMMNGPDIGGTVWRIPAY